jgi:hypothetical protein
VLCSNEFFLVLGPAYPPPLTLPHLCGSDSLVLTLLSSSKLTSSAAASSKFFAGLPSANLDSNPELLAVGAMSSIHQVVQGWCTFRSKRDEIFQPRKGFLGVFNEMMSEIRCLLSTTTLRLAQPVAAFDG